MKVYILRRLLLLVPLLALVTMISFSIILLLPGDPALAILGEDRSQNRQLYETLRREMGLDQPIPVQYLRWAGRALSGDLGLSAHTQRPVSELVLQGLGPTVELTLLAMVVAVAVALPVGILSATRPNSRLDALGSLFALSGVAVPSFWLGILLIYLFSVWLRLLPPAGYAPPSAGLWPSLRLMIMPALALGGGIAAVLMRQVRSAMLEVLHQDYVVAARARGLHERVVVMVHALKNALIPVVTVIGLQAGHLIGGAVVVETIFSVPGMGRLAVSSIFFRDFPVVQAVVLLMAVAVLLTNLATDVLYGFLDPRIRYS